MTRLNRELHKLWPFNLGVDLLCNIITNCYYDNIKQFINLLVDHPNQLIKHAVEIKHIFMKNKRKKN